MYLLKILAFVATITAKNNYHGTNQKQKNQFLTNQKATISAIIVARIFGKYTVVDYNFSIKKSCLIYIS
jgi:hypothetical protein